MKKYKDGFQIRTDTLATGGQGIFTAVENENAHTQNTKAPPPKFGARDSDVNISPIRTLADDIQSTVTKDSVSLAGQAVKRSPKRELTEAPNVEIEQNNKRLDTKRKRFSPMVVIVLLSLIIFGGSVFLFASKQGIAFGNLSLSLPKFSFNFSFLQRNPDAQNNQTPGSEESLLPDALLKIDHHHTMTVALGGNPGNKREFEQKLLTQKEDAAPGVTMISLSSVEHDDEMEYPVLASDFLRLLDTSVGSNLVRSITDFSFGVMSLPNKDTAEAFLVAEIHDYEESFAAMLNWERNMTNELYGIFHSVGESTFAVNSSFSDTVVNKTDTRELVTSRLVRNSTESEMEEFPVLTYAFPGKNTLVITGSRESLAEIISRVYPQSPEN